MLSRFSSRCDQSLPFSVALLFSPSSPDPPLFLSPSPRPRFTSILRYHLSRDYDPYSKSGQRRCAGDDRELISGCVLEKHTYASRCVECSVCVCTRMGKSHIYSEHGDRVLGLEMLLEQSSIMLSRASHTCSTKSRSNDTRPACSKNLMATVYISCVVSCR